MNLHPVKRLILLSVFLVSCQVIASEQLEPSEHHLIVVDDIGGESAIPYYVAISSDNVDEKSGYVPVLNRSQPFGFADMLPVKSGFLSVGKVSAKQLKLSPGMTPFFIVGSDKASFWWLNKNAEYLRSINAVGLVTQVNTIRELSAIADAAKGLELRPMSADDVARKMGIQHYPVLIKSDGISQ
jgi:integrating conjugative element protein (TIGR03765 family)